jgi:hypothetical protein
MKWIAHVYGNSQFSWSHAYSWYEFTDQNIVHAVEDLGGAGFGRQVCALVARMTNRRLTHHLRRSVETYTGERITVPVVRYARQSAIGDRGRGGRYSLWPCVCGGFARVAICAPEVPRRLLCHCGRMMAAAEFGMPDDVRFPDEYKTLSPSREACAIFAKRDSGRGAQPRLGPTAAKILQIPGVQAPHGLTSKEIAAVIGVGVMSARDTLRRMEAKGWIRRSLSPDKPEVGRRPEVWTVDRDPLAYQDVIVMGEWKAKRLDHGQP